MTNMNEVEKTNAMCIWLIKTLCLDTNATEAKILQKGVNHLGKPLGDWEIVIRRKKASKK